MSEKKKIDRLFQEKLKDFEVHPKNTVWENIAERVQGKKKKRRVIPIWLRLTGVAAGLALLITLGNNLFKSENNEVIPSETNAFVNEDTTNKVDTSTSAEDEVKQVSFTKDEFENALNNNSITSSTSSQNTVSNNSNSKNILVNNTISEKDSSSKSNEIESTADINTRDALVSASTLNTAKINFNTNIQLNATIIPFDDIIENRQSIFDAVATNDENIFEKKEDIKKNKWQLAPTIAPVYFNTLGEGSSIANDFISNPKSGDVNMSYGINASYAINEKISIRSGINKVQLGYNTNEILVFNSLNSSLSNSRIKNIALNTQARDMDFATVNSFSFNNNSVPLLIMGQKASINQQLGFLEVPLELEYKLLDKKLGINLVGGFSALLLESNNIYSILNGQTSLIGEATNINKTSYSANLGLGLNYKMSNKFNLNLEPVFKYQLNTFYNTSGDFRPYFIGLYTGVRFKF